MTWKKPMFKSIIRVLSANNTKKINETPVSGKLEISEVIVCEILKNLEDFERKEKYLAKNIKIQELANKLKTNDKYLSKTIKQYYSKKFVDYVNDLRIDYAIKRLKSNKRFRSYSIKYIADEVGFSNPNTFSKAFEKRQGIKPSSYIKQLSNLD